MTAAGDSASQPAAARQGFSRRRLLATGAGAVVVASAGVGAGAALVRGDHSSASSGPAVHPFFGEHQGGITTPVQDRLHFAAFDVTTASRQDVIDLLHEWTEAAARMTQGQSPGPYGPVGGLYEAPPYDTG